MKHDIFYIFKYYVKISLFYAIYKINSNFIYIDKQCCLYIQLNLKLTTSNLEAKVVCHELFWDMVSNRLQVVHHNWKKRC